MTLPSNPAVGIPIQFVDAKGTWNNHPVTFTGGKLDGLTSDFVYSAQGTSLTLLYIDSAIGWKVVTSGTPPICRTRPSFTDHYATQTIQPTPAVWSGSPTRITYQWQIKDYWVDDNDTNGNIRNIDGATQSSFTPGSDMLGNKNIRIVETATNASGSSSSASAWSPVIVNPPPLSGAIACWPLDETAGVRVDATGNGHDLTDNNGTGYATGKFGNAASFAGDGSYLSAPLAMSGNMTVAFLMKGKAVVSDGGSWPTLDIQVTNVEGVDVLVFASVQNAYSPSISTIPINDGHWHQVVLTIAANGGYQALIDNISQIWVDWGSCSITQLILNPFNETGLIDQVCVWPRILSSDEIASLYNSGNFLAYPFA